MAHRQKTSYERYIGLWDELATYIALRQKAQTFLIHHLTYGNRYWFFLSTKNLEILFHLFIFDHVRSDERFLWHSYWIHSVRISLYLGSDIHNLIRWKTVTDSFLVKFNFFMKIYNIPHILQRWWFLVSSLYWHWAFKIIHFLKIWMKIKAVS